MMGPEMLEKIEELEARVVLAESDIKDRYKDIMLIADRIRQIEDRLYELERV